MDNTLTWIIIALFYAPLHYLVPILVVVMRNSDRSLRDVVKRTLLDCTLSMLASFSLAIWLVFREQMTAAMLVLLLSMALPYGRILLRPTRKA